MRSSIYFVKNTLFQFKQAQQYWLTSHEVKVRQDILIIGSIYVYTFKSCNVVMLYPSPTIWFNLKGKQNRVRLLREASSVIFPLEPEQETLK